MKSACRSCGSMDWHHMRSTVDEDSCDQCSSSLGVASLPDVYWPGHAYKSEALDVEFTSRGQKAQYLKDHGISEAGDMKTMPKTTWVEGTREYRRKQFDKDRPMIRETLRRYLNRDR